MAPRGPAYAGRMSLVNRYAATALGAVLLLAGCSGGSSPSPGTSGLPPSDPVTSSTGSSGAAYVALGDSFTAGPGLADPQPGAGFCQRSRLNWPTQVAALAGITDVADLSCAGATTADVLTTVDSPDLGTATDLVTIGVGGNDGGLFASLLRACSGGGGACAPYAKDRAPAILDRSVPALVELVDAVRAKAPDARIVVVGYLRILPDTGTCPTVGIPASDAAAVVGTEEALDAAQASAAKQAGAEFVSLRDISDGHDACAGNAAWTNGGSAADGDGIMFHPRAAGMRAVAEAVDAQLRRSSQTLG